MLEVLNGCFRGMTAGPQPLARSLDLISQMNGIDAVTLDALRLQLQGAAAGNDLANLFRRALASWDNEEAAWTDNTEKNSQPRRELIYKRLALDPVWVNLCETNYPFHPISPPVVIAKAHALWYDASVRIGRDFYWAAYINQLRSQGWPETSIQQLDDSTTSVVARLSDPTAAKAYQSKGLVVGYVQSGKTANFTGVIAKAADAGYKLIVVLAGTLDVLRSQTQRRIDKDLIGQELLAADYVGDADWVRFVKHGGRPSQRGSFDFYRLTRPEDDYRSLGPGLEALQFEATDRTKPLYDKANLFGARTRIAIVKKNSRILDRLIKDLQRTEKEFGQGAPLDQIPALIIDDESDQAGINVKRPNSDGVTEDRTSTNSAIVQLLGILPRAQYVGYTATPFANVFVDPNDEAGIFPKDFLVSLPRPSGYMGVSDFYDLDGSANDPDSRPNERDYVRPVVGDDGEKGNLQKAIDSFVLSGAIKRFREKFDPSLASSFRHHTMLVHCSERVVEQKALAEQVTKIFAKAGYDGGTGSIRLEKLLESDFKRVYAERGDGLPFPESLLALAPFIGECLSAIGPARGAVRIVNNENKDQTPDFDRRPVWKILVGGTKLSRGYTVEGLTVSYYRRRAGAADTLMQMGRWFGFRRGYGDLVRLYIGTEERLPGRAKGTLNLYQAFGAVCRDEETFREQLKRYASLTEPRMTPARIPPLVPQHMLRPTAPNKMYNAVLTYTNFGNELSESTLAPCEPEEIIANNDLLDSIVGDAPAETVKLSAVHPAGKKSPAKRHELEANVIILKPGAVIKLLNDYKWPSVNPLQLQIEFLTKHGAEDPEIDDWLLLGPCISKPLEKRLLAGKDFHVVNRSRRDGEKYRFNTYNDPIHRRFAEHIACQKTLSDANPALQVLRRPKRAVLIYYPITEETERKKVTPPYTVGFTLLFPPNKISVPPRFSVHRANYSEDAVVDADGANLEQDDLCHQN